MLALPFLLWAVVFLALLDAKCSVRQAALASFTVATVIVLIVTEGLSVVHAITPLWVTLAWAAVLIFAFFLLVRRVRGGLLRLRGLVGRRWDRWDVVTALMIGCFAVGTLATALLYPPTEGDCLAYHMPRVLFWFQNRSVAFFPTADPRQVFSSPLAEYFILNLKALSGGSDRLASLVQWLSYVFSIVAVSLIAQRLGATRRGQQAAAVVAATVPMAALQASTQQNDLTCALWCLVAVVAVLGFVGEESRGTRRALLWALWAGIAVGLAVQTKATAYLVLPPFFVWFLVVSVKRDGWKRTVMHAATVSLCFVMLNMAWFTRNALLLDGDFMALHAPGNGGILVRAHDPSSIATNALKNVSMVFGTPFDRINQVTAAGVRGAVGLYRGNLENPMTRLSPTDGFSIPSTIASSATAPDPTTAALVILAMMVLLIGPRAPRRTGTILYMACAVVAFFTCAGLFAYNVAVTRILVVPLLLLVPLVGPAVSMPVGGSRRAITALWCVMLGLAVVTGLAAVIWNGTSPLVSWRPALRPRPVQLSIGYWNTPYRDRVFRSSTTLEAPLNAIAATSENQGIQRIGIVVHPPLGFFTYSIMSLLPDREFRYVRFTVLPDRIKGPPFEPQAIMEIVPTALYPAVLGDGAPRGKQLMDPQRIEGGVILFYRVL